MITDQDRYDLHEREQGLEQIVTKDETTDKQKVTIHMNDVKGDISIDPHVKRQMTNLTINVTEDAIYKGTYKVVDAAGVEYQQTLGVGDTAAGQKTLSVPKTNR